MPAQRKAANRYWAFLRIKIRHMNLIFKIVVGLIVLNISPNSICVLAQNYKNGKNQLNNCVSNPDKFEDQIVYKDSISKAHFPGGEDALLQYMRRNIKISSSNTEWPGRILVTFVIDRMGKTRNVCIDNFVPFDVQSQVYKLIENMPTWIPGTVRGTRVSTRIWLPIQICLEE